ncbi:MAG: hypothetical protein KGL39_31805 [Patescibacteria group bacterium]|nr:hypothetical protein [Patescibacteria group bacterium]
MQKVNLFAGITKVDESKREVTGVLVQEQPDRSGEIFDYESSKPYFKAWNDEFAKSTGGSSVGNVREMHGGTAAGKFTAMSYDDEAKKITVTAKVVDRQAWEKVAEGVYTGFSIGGNYLDRWDDGDLKRYTAQPVEGSLVDYPCVPGATFELVRSSGVEMRKFNKAAKTKRVAGEDLPASAFAYVGDPEKTDTWKLPIKFSDEEKTKRHIRNALARFGQTEDIPESEKPKVKAKILAAARKHGIDVKAEGKKFNAAANAMVRKGLYSVSQLASLLESLAWLQQSAQVEADIEGDGSGIPADLAEEVEHLSEILEEMASEEVSELIAGLKPGKEAKKMADNTELAKRRADHLKKAREAHERIGKHLDAAAKAHADMHDHLKAMEADRDERDDEDDERDEKRRKEKEDKDKTEKSANSELAAQVADIANAVTALTEFVTKGVASGSAPAVKANATAAVSKEQDNGAAKAEAIDPKDPQAALKAMRAVHGQPSLPILR